MAEKLGVGGGRSELLRISSGVDGEK